MALTETFETVKVEYEGNGVTWLYMNRPDKRNAMNPTMHKEMAYVIDQLEKDDDTRAVVLTGAGPAYCAGQDIKETFRAGAKAPHSGRFPKSVDTWRFEQLFNFEKPTIAMVNGWCCGGAFTHLFSCDFAIAAEDALFCLSEINWGIIPGGIVTKVIQQELGYRDALYNILVAEPFDGVEAAKMRLINYAVPAVDLRKATLELAGKLMEKNPAVYRSCKEAYHAVLFMNWDQAAEYLSAKSDQLTYTDPGKGMEAGMHEFLDTKTYKPGEKAYPKS